MGKADQLAKRIFQEETPLATGHRVAVDVPPEVPVGALQPDGVVRVVSAPGLAELDAPWCRLRVEATLDAKMPGDHVDRAAREAKGVVRAADARVGARAAGGERERERGQRGQLEELGHGHCLAHQKNTPAEAK